MTVSTIEVIGRGLRGALRALRDFHSAQVYAWECIGRSCRQPVSRSGPLSWVPSLDGPRLTGCYLPIPERRTSDETTRH